MIAKHRSHCAHSDRIPVDEAGRTIQRSLPIVRRQTAQ
jgi:hypothetical protein